MKVLEHRERANRPSAAALFLLIATLVACEASADDSWEQFLSDPGEGSEQKLLEAIDESQCGWGNPANEKVVPERVRYPLFDLISGGNDGAFLVGLSVIRCLDGGHLQDFYESAGKYMERHPQRFLSVATEKKVGSSDLVKMATSMAIVDDLDAELAKVAERIALLSEVDDETVVAAKADCIRALQDQGRNLERAKADLNETK